MDTGWSDAHAHPHLLTHPDAAWKRGDVLGIRRVLANAIRPEDWDAVAEVARTRPGVIPLYGVHPWHAGEVEPDWELRLTERLLADPAAGVGEIGLDSKLTDTPLEDQVPILREQIRIANQVGRPCTVHVVGAWNQLHEVLAEERPQRMLLHAYSGGPGHLDAFLPHPVWFSFGGAVIRQANSEKVRQAVALVPDDRILLETDSPFQHPDGRDHEQEPAGLIRIAERVAEIRGVPIDALRRQTEANLDAFLGR